MKNIKSLLRSNRGATSVLIMVMMIILMVFGLAALTTSAVSKKLALKNANWLKGYYQLQGKAEQYYAELEESLNLEDPLLDNQKLETRLHAIMQEQEKFSFQKLSKGNTLYQLDAAVVETEKEVPKSIQMQFLVLKENNRYRLKISKWTQTQAEIFNEEDELHFTDINIKLEK